MSEIRYMISDAARQVGVEAHVLRSGKKSWTSKWAERNLDIATIPIKRSIS